MIGLQEMRRRMEKPENIEAGRQVVAELQHGFFDYDKINMFGTGYDDNQKTVKPADFKELKESIRAIPLRKIIKEFLARSGTTGIAGAAYLVPTKIHQIMFDSAVQADIVNDISIAIIPSEEIPGATHQVDIAVDDSYRPKPFLSGGQIPTETIATVAADLDFSEGFGVNFRITNDLIEDSQFDLIEMHLRNAGREMGEFASNLAATVLIAGADGDGTLNTEGAGANTTTLTDIINGVDANLMDHYLSDRLLTSHHQIWGEIMQDTTFSMDASGVRDDLIRNGYPPKLVGLDIVYSECTVLSASATTGTAYEDLDSVVFTKEYSLLSGRKRWLRIEKYSDPVRDLVGATVTSRQDSISVYDDSICRVRET